MSEDIQEFDTIVIGGGQAGLTLGYYLAHQNRDFIILDANERVGGGWRNRWDSLRVFTKAKLSKLPGFPLPTADNYYPTKDEVADYLEAYADQFDLPVQLDTPVDALTRDNHQYLVGSDSQRFRADHVVVASGPFHTPSTPGFADELDSSITQFHSSEYRNPNQLPDGAVLVVGAGNSGAEIARELATTGRSTYLSGRDTGNIPFRLFNSRIFWLLATTVFTLDTPIGRRMKKRARGRGDPLIRLTSEDLRWAEVKRVPRVSGIIDGMPRLEDGRDLDVESVVWSTGFRPDYSWIELPELTLDETGYPINKRGVVESEPGLYFVGLPYQHTLVSSTIAGVCPDARYIADHLRSKDETGTPDESRDREPRAKCATDNRYLLGL